MLEVNDPEFVGIPLGRTLPEQQVRPDDLQGPLQPQPLSHSLIPKPRDNRQLRIYIFIHPLYTPPYNYL